MRYGRQDGKKLMVYKPFIEKCSKLCIIHFTKDFSKSGKGAFMRINILKSLVVLSLPLIFLAGCAKDQVIPDSGTTLGKQSAAAQKESASAADTSAADKAAAEAAAKAAADKAAREAAAKAAADKAAADKAAADAADAAAKAAAKVVTEDAALKMVFFEFDSYVLGKPTRDVLQGNAEYLLKKYKGKVVVEGHADERGSDEYNLALGENRAKAVMNYLVTLGVPPEQLSVVSYGEERPLDAGHVEESWAKNRRAAFTKAK